MGSELILFVALFLVAVAVFLFTFALFRSNQEAEVMSWASGVEPTPSSSPIINMSRPLVHQFTIKYARRFQNRENRKSLERKILTSGLSRELNVDEFIGLQILWGIVGPILLFFLNFTLEMGLPWFVIPPLGGVGFYFPHLHAGGMRRKRVAEIQADLPFFVDLLALCTESGLDFVGAMNKISSKAEESVLGEEFRTVLQDIKVGSTRANALRGLAERLDMTEVTSFTAVVIDADEMGGDIAQVLKDQAAQMRLERFVRARKAGAQASEALMIPALGIITPVVFIMVLGPVLLKMVYGE